MSSRSVKFEISLEKLTVKFEGDIQTAERMHSQISGALNSLASAQNRLLSSGTGAGTAPATAPDVSGTRRRRRRKPTQGIDAAIIDVDAAPVEDGDGSGAASASTTNAKRPRRSGAAQTELITKLKAEGFFGDRRGIRDIREALSKKGHTFESQDISPILVSLTKKGVLQRERNAEGQWAYYSD